GARGPAFAQVQRLVCGDDPERRIAAFHPATGEKALTTVDADALQVHQLASVVQRHQQHVTLLAQVVRAAALGDQVGMVGVSTASITPQQIGVLGSGLLALVLLGASLALGLLYALCN